MFLTNLYRNDRIWPRPVPSTLLSMSTSPVVLNSMQRVTSLVLIVNLLLLSNQVPIYDAQQVGGGGGGGGSLVQPTFIDDMNSHQIRENTAVGQAIYQLKARLEPDAQLGARIQYNIHGTKLLEVDKSSGWVRVGQPIDREQTSDSLTFYVSATTVYTSNTVDGAGNLKPQLNFGPATNISITVFILDDNDNPPRIVHIKALDQEYDSTQQLTAGPPFLTGRNPIIRVNVSESAPIGSVIVDLIEAQDVDKASSSPLQSICVNCSPEFELRPIDEKLLNDRLKTSIVLVDRLTFYPRNNIRPLNIIVTDGKYNTSVMIEVTIENVQNRPPLFIGSSTCIVRENVPIDTLIMTLQAIDGDVVALDEFGAASTRATAVAARGGRPSGGRDILYDLVAPPRATAAGGFEQQAGQLVNSLFKLHPLTGQLQVANRIDRESFLGLGDTVTLRARARELTIGTDARMRSEEASYETILDVLAPFVDGAPEASATIELSVLVVDANDNGPHWLNASEIAALDMDQSPEWFRNLPNDREPSRHYQLAVRENSPAGSPITSQKEMFVYDLDSAENANFRITLDDPFHLFDVEPKQVSGFAMVTLKLAGGGGGAGAKQRPLMLDYENQNERSFIIQLIATETNTAERRSSKAQVQIRVLDMNDNAPEFRESAYSANIREDAPAGKTILMVQADDRDEISRDQVSYSLHGASAHLFEIPDPKSGLIRVAECDPFGGDSAAAAAASEHPRPSSGHCIDFEHQRSHHLVVEASDGELSTKVPLTIYVDDASDNAPVFKLPVLDVVIEEGSSRLDPPIKIEASDVDQSSVLSYSIVEGNFEGLFSIDNSTGEIQLTRPIRISHDDSASSSLPHDGLLIRQPMNKMTLIVQASDGVASANGTIRIDVLDANDNAPAFIRAQYSAEISALASAGQTVVRVSAIDSDRGNNARVSYKILRGSYGQFEIDESSGLITVASSARELDVARRANYTLEVAAQDHGLIARSSSVLVHIRVLDSIGRPPEFRPKVQRITVLENLMLNNEPIYQMQVTDSELQLADRLTFEPGPIEALDKNGQPVNDSERLERLFSVADRSGDIQVNSALDHDFAAHVNLTVFVRLRSPASADGGGGGIPKDSNATPPAGLELGPPQAGSGGGAGEEMFSARSVGYLIITVLDHNDRGPIFAAPWSVAQPELAYQMLEELPVGSVVAHLTASDADSRISHFKIEPPSEYFELASPQSGVIVNKRIIDYDALMSQTFRLPSAASHRLLTPLVASAPVSQATTSTGASTTLASSNVPSSSSSGNNIIQFNVYAFDSGTPQLSTRATVSVEILPVNDWDCKFEQPVYEIRVKENTKPDIILAQVRAHDLDHGEQHSSLRYQLLGEHSELFQLDSKTGTITVSGRGELELDRERLSRASFALTVIARDEPHQGGHSAAPAAAAAAQIVPPSRSNNKQQQQQQQQLQGQRTCSAIIRVQVEDVNDNPPLFSRRVYEVTAYDTDQPRVPLLDLIVRDSDSTSGANKSAPINSFKIISGNTNDIFSVSQSGVLYANKLLNESLPVAGEPIQLQVQVRQQSAHLASGPLASYTDLCTVRIRYVQINRNGPEWRLDASKPIAVEENSKPGTLVAQLKCHDRDLEPAGRQASAASRLLFDTPAQQLQSQAQSPGSPIRYWIKENGQSVSETREFRLDPVSGKLTTRRELDRESEELYQLIVACEDNGRPQSLENVIPIYVRVLDVDDNRPEFLIAASGELAAPERTGRRPPAVSFAVEERQSKGLPVGELKAIDRDLTDGSNPISYCLIEGNESNEFTLDRLTGILYTNQTLDRERQSSYELLIKAINDGTTCESHSSPANSSSASQQQQQQQQQQPTPADASSLLLVRIEVLDINDNAPVFRRPIHRAGAHYRALLNTLVTQVAALDPDAGLNGSLSYKISEILMHKTSTPANQAPSMSRARYDIEAQPPPPSLSKPIKLVQFPFRIDQQGNVYTQQLLTQYQLMSMFVVQVEASELAEPWRTATTKLEVYIYETGSQLKMRINLRPRLVENHRAELENLLSNATKCTAIINRARSYYGNNGALQESAAIGLAGQQAPKATHHHYQKALTDSQMMSTNSIANAAQPSNIYGLGDDQQPTSTNIHLIFVDNFRIVNPYLVMEKFDLTSAQLFMPQSLISQSQSTSANQNQKSTQAAAAGDSQQQQQQQQQAQNNYELQLSVNEVSSLIGDIAPASAVLAAEYQPGGAYTLFNSVNWLENPAILYVTLSVILTLVGLITCLFGCCCTSRIKDHIVRVAMDKLVKQQAMQAKINEQVLAATGGGVGGQSASANGQDYLLQQGGFISAFDATKGCISNNNENMSILHRAMQDSGGEFIDPNYTTLNWQSNIGAHYYDTSELEEAGDMCADPNGGGGFMGGGSNNNKQQQYEESRASLSLRDEDYEDDDGDLNNAQTVNMVSKVITTNGTNADNNNITINQRQRQQVPKSNK